MISKLDEHKRQLILAIIKFAAFYSLLELGKTNHILIDLFCKVNEKPFINVFIK